MSQIVTMPQLGETVTEGTILRWLVQIGDEVKEDDPILEISTDKVDTEVPSPFTGQVTSLLVEEGETVEVGASLLELNGESVSSSVREETSNEVETVSEPVEEVVDVKVEEVKSTPVAKSTNLKLSPVVRKLASEISSMVAEKGFWNLDNPIVKVTPPNTHIPFAPVLEDAFIPSAEKVIKAIKELQ